MVCLNLILSVGKNFHLDSSSCSCTGSGRCRCSGVVGIGTDIDIVGVAMFMILAWGERIDSRGSNELCN